MGDSVKVSPEDRRMLLTHTPAPSSWSYVFTKWLVGCAISVCAVLLGAVPLGYYLIGCGEQSSYEKDLINYQTWQSLGSHECFMDDERRCKSLQVVLKLAPQIQQQNEEDVAYELVARALESINSGLFEGRAGFTDPDRDLAIDVINKVQPVPDGYARAPGPPDIAQIPWNTLLLVACGLLALCFWIFVLYASHKRNEYLAELTQPMEGLDPELRSSYLDLLRKEIEVRDLIAQAPVENQSDMRKLQARTQELRHMLAGLRDEQNARDRAQREMKIHEISTALSQICADAEGRLAYLRSQTENAVSAAEIARST